MATANTWYKKLRVQCKFQGFYYY